MRRIRDALAASLHPLAVEAIEPGSVVHADGWEGFTGVAGYGNYHEITIRKRSASNLMPQGIGW
jgi:hypothetical protein